MVSERVCQNVKDFSIRFFMLNILGIISLLLLLFFCTFRSGINDMALSGLSPSAAVAS